MYKIQTVYLPVEVENASGNYIPDDSVLIVKEQGEMDKYWIDLVNQKQGYFFTPEQLNEYTANVVRQALETAAEKAEPNILNKRSESAKFTIVDVDKESITNTFEETFKRFEI